MWTLSGGSENLNESGSPHDINDAGHIVGESFPSGNAFIWKRNTGKQFLGNPLTGRQIWTSINQYDDVIGFYGKLNSYQLFQWDPHRGFRIMDLSCGILIDITNLNDHGVFCLSSDDYASFSPQSRTQISIVYNPGRKKTILNNFLPNNLLDFTVSRINNEGWIVGNGYDEWSQRIFVLIPKNIRKRK